MGFFEVTEYEHFVSFLCKKKDGQNIIIQYRSSQVWKDEDGVWQVRDGQKPSYSFAYREKFEPVQLSPIILQAFMDVTEES